MKSPSWHSLLARQLRRHFADGLPAGIGAFLDDVDRAYREADKDRCMLERSLEITSEELLELNKNIETELRQKQIIEHELHDAKLRMLSAQRHEALGRLAGSIAHDFNNIMAIIRGNADLIEALADAQTVESVRQIQQATERASSLTRQILAYTRNQMLTLDKHDINDLIRSSRDFLHGALGKDIALDLKLSTESLPVLVDQEQFRQVLLNIASNARDAMNSKGVFVLRTGRCGAQRFTCRRGMNGDTTFPDACGICSADSDRILVELTDNGSGIKPEILPRIFEPYFTTKAMGQGTGLGLSAALGVVGQMGGQIHCASRVGVGTQLQIRLPAAGAGIVTGTVPIDLMGATIAHSPDIGKGLRIFVIDDEAAIVTFVANMLTREGFDVEVANSPMEALIRLRTMQEKIDVILCDMTMPGMSGRTLSKQILHIQRDAKIVFMTVYSGDMRAAVGGEIDYPILSKPFSREQLLSAVFSRVAGQAAGV